MNRAYIVSGVLCLNGLIILGCVANQLQSKIGDFSTAFVLFQAFVGSFSIGLVAGAAIQRRKTKFLAAVADLLGLPSTTRTEARQDALEKVAGDLGESTPGTPGSTQSP